MFGHQANTVMLTEVTFIKVKIIIIDVGPLSKAYTKTFHDPNKMQRLPHTIAYSHRNSSSKIKCRSKSFKFSVEIGPNH